MALKPKRTAGEKRAARELVRWLIQHPNSDIDRIIRGMGWGRMYAPKAKFHATLATARELGWPIRNDRRTFRYSVAQTDDELLKYADEWTSRVVTTVGRLLMAVVRRTNPTTDMLYVMTAFRLFMDALRQTILAKAKSNLATLDSLMQQPPE